MLHPVDKLHSTDQMHFIRREGTVPCPKGGILICGLAGGVYVCKLLANGREVKTLKMVIR